MIVSTVSFLLNDTPTTWIQPYLHTLSLHDPLPISDPRFSTDGASLHFISSRATGSRDSAGLDIWRASRDAQGRWQAPTRLPEPVNSAQAEWFPRPAADGWLYFGSRRPGGLGKDDIWRARRTTTGAWQRSEEHTSELQSLMRISYAVFCLKKKTQH